MGHQPAPARMTLNSQQPRPQMILDPRQAQAQVQAQMMLGPNLLRLPRATNELSCFTPERLSPSSCSRSSSSFCSIVDTAVILATGQRPQTTTPRARRIGLDDTARNEGGVRDRTGDARKNPIRTRRRNPQIEHGVGGMEFARKHDHNVQHAELGGKILRIRSKATGAEEQGSRSAQRDFVLTKEVAVVSQRS